MTTAFPNQKKLTLNIQTPLYSLLEKQAEETGVSLNEFIEQLLNEAMGEWADYCKTLHQLSCSEKQSFHVYLK